MRYNDEELLHILSGGVFLDNTAADILTARGFGKYIGVKVLKNYTNGVMERFSESLINSPYEGYIRNAWINFNGSAPNAAVLEPLCGDVEIISDLITIKKDYLGPCTAVYKNELGGKICTTGYLFPTFLQYNAKRTQLLNIFDGLSPLPVRVNKNHKIVPIFRSGKNGGYILMLANMSFDDSGKLTVDIKTDIKKSSRLSKNGSFKDLSFTETTDGIRIELENISSWEEVIITN